MPLTVALAGDTMFGRGVAARLAEVGPRSLVAQEVCDVAAEADLFVLNLECCISERGEPWEAPGKPFFFRAPPVAVETLTWLGVHAVTLANNHALDFGPDALHDTLGYLAGAGIAAVGAGADEAQAREPAVLQARGVRLGVLGATDHPADFAAGPQRSGVAYADLHAGVPAWLVDGVRRLRAAADLVLVTPHWGPNMTPEPVGPTWGGVLIAHHMEGKPVTREHGGPVRLYVAPMYGYKSLKWLERIEVVSALDEPSDPGYWENLGYDVDAWVGRSNGLDDVPT